VAAQPAAKLNQPVEKASARLMRKGDDEFHLLSFHDRIGKMSNAGSPYFKLLKVPQKGLCVNEGVFP